jgi:hypothetical protein
VDVIDAKRRICRDEVRGLLLGIYLAGARHGRSPVVLMLLGDGRSRSVRTGGRIVADWRSRSTRSGVLSARRIVPAIWLQVSAMCRRTGSGMGTSWPE